MLINRKAVKLFALDMASYRAKKFTRVGKQFTDRAEFHLQEWIRKEIASLPSLGKTIL